LINSDVPILSEDLRAGGIEWPLPGLNIMMPSMCSGKKQSVTLPPHCSFTWVAHSKAHDAMGDVKAVGSYKGANGLV